MCYVACGRLDGYWASSVKAWDVAAGAIIIAEAGGVLTDLEGAAFDLADPKLISTSTTALHGRLLDALAKAEKRYGEKD